MAKRMFTALLTLFMLLSLASFSALADEPSAEPAASADPAVQNSDDSTPEEPTNPEEPTKTPVIYATFILDGFAAGADVQNYTVTADASNVGTTLDFDGKTYYGIYDTTDPNRQPEVTTGTFDENTQYALMLCFRAADEYTLDSLTAGNVNLSCNGKTIPANELKIDDGIATAVFTLSLAPDTPVTSAAFTLHGFTAGAEIAKLTVTAADSNAGTSFDTDDRYQYYAFFPSNTEGASALTKGSLDAGAEYYMMLQFQAADHYTVDDLTKDKVTLTYNGTTIPADELNVDSGWAIAVFKLTPAPAADPSPSEAPAATPAPTAAPAVKHSPKTGDEANLTLWIALLAASSLAVTAAAKRKKSK